MKMDNLEPGTYKIRKKDYNVPPGMKIYRTMQTNAVHLLRVTGHGDKKRYFLDHDTYGIHPTELNDAYEVISKYSGEPQIGNTYLTISFADAAGEKFEFKVKDVWSLRNLFETMPWLKKPFGYIKRKIR